MACDGINRLGRVLQKRMGQMAETDSIIDFGTIKRNLALVPDGYDDIVIPKGSYSIMRNGEYWSPSSGDRVVIAWVGSEIVVLGRLGG